MKDENKDLRDRTKEFAIRIVRMFSALPMRNGPRFQPKQKTCGKMREFEVS